MPNPSSILFSSLDLFQLKVICPDFRELAHFNESVNASHHRITHMDMYFPLFREINDTDQSIKIWPLKYLHLFIRKCSLKSLHRQFVVMATHHIPPNPEHQLKQVVRKWIRDKWWIYNDSRERRVTYKRYNIEINCARIARIAFNYFRQDFFWVETSVWQSLRL